MAEKLSDIMQSALKQIAAWNGVIHRWQGGFWSDLRWPGPGAAAPDWTKKTYFSTGTVRALEVRGLLEPIVSTHRGRDFVVKYRLPRNTTVLELILDEYRDAIFGEKYDAENLDRLSMLVEQEADRIGYTDHSRLYHIHTEAERRSEREESRTTLEECGA